VNTSAGLGIVEVKQSVGVPGGCGEYLIAEGVAWNSASFGLAIERGGIQQMTLDWTVHKAEDPGWWDARLTGDAEGRSYRIVRRDSEHYFELRVVLGETRFELPFSTLEDAMGAAQNLEAAQTHEPHQEMGNDFPVQYRSTVDGDRYVIVDERHHDMTGWQIEVERGTGKRVVEAFTRDQGWYCYDGNFNCFGSNNPSVDLRHPWSAWCDHGETVVRWIPPAG
jgi:hypothetical protein